MSGALPRTPKSASGGQGAALHLRPFEKGRPKLFYGKVLWREQNAINIEYSVFARPADILCGGNCRFSRGVAPNPTTSRLASEPIKSGTKTFQRKSF